MTRRPRQLLPVLVIAPLLLAACAGGDAPEEGSTDAGQAVPAPPPSTEGTGGSDQGTGGTEDGSAGGSSSSTDGATTGPDDAGGTDGATADAPASGPVEITLAASGDVLAHTWVNTSARMYAGATDRSLIPPPGASYDYTPMFEDVADLVSSADLAICHMETPLSPDNTDLSIPDTLSFNTPHEMATALAGAGYDGCDFASNHTMDRGLAGMEGTEQVLRDAGMGYAGPTAHEDRSGLAEVYDVPAEGGDVRVAHLAYTYTYPNAGMPTTDIPGEAPWLVDASWPSIGSAGILEQAEAAKAEGADFVVVSMHWGNEYQAEPTPDQRQISADLLESDAVDLILGTHVHVIQPCEQINGKHVIYGLGNSLSNQSPMTASSLVPATQEGMVAMFTLSRDAEGEVTTQMRYQPTRVEIPPERAPGHIIRLVSPDTYPETWERTTTTVDSLGGCGAEPIS